MMQQKNDRRRPSAAIYRPPVVRQGRFNNSIQGNTSRFNNPDVVVGDAPKMHRRYNPYAQQNYNNIKKKYMKQKEFIPVRNHALPPISGNMITVLNGQKLGKNVIFTTILSFCKSSFVPFNFKFIDEDAVFYIDDYATARELKSINRRVNAANGLQLIVEPIRSRTSNYSFDPDTLEMIKTVVSARYDAVFHSLNLTKFYNDENMKSAGLRLPLSKNVVFSTIARIIKDHIPYLEVLELAENNLYTLSPLSAIIPVCKQIKCLNLKQNNLKSISNLNCLKDSTIVDIVLDGNPLCDVFKDKTEYISAVRNRFPKLQSLDGTLLPPPIGFDLGIENLPASKKSFFSADDVKGLVLQFLDQYYSIFDSGDRTKLLEAYHDQAYFSLCLSMNIHKSGKGLGVYNCDNRNLLAIFDSSARLKRLKQGKLSIVNALSELPQTMHDPTSFSIDIFHVSANLMSFSVVGVFKEVGADINNATSKTFYRTFVVAPHGQGFVITNETLFIAHASRDQQATAFKVPAPTPSQSPASSTDERNPSEKQLMVIELSKQTRMNVDFSTKCLEENDWNFQRALEVFMKFQSEGKLPPEAFISLNI